jgi:transposase
VLQFIRYYRGSFDLQKIVYTAGDKNNAPIVLYEYQPDRKAKHPAAFLSDFKGYLHADGYDGYHSLPGDIIVVGCWQHLRRKFDEALKSLPQKDRDGSNAARGKQYCDKLFDLERKFDDMSPDERFKNRLALSKPIIDELYVWLGSFNIAPKTQLGIAAKYAVNQRKYLDRFLLDGRLEINNNCAERSIKPFVIDRNYAPNKFMCLRGTRTE